jgi:hypothetical protein
MVFELWLCTLSVERRLESERSQLATLMHPFTLRKKTYDNCVPSDATREPIHG